VVALSFSPRGPVKLLFLLLLQRLVRIFCGRIDGAQRQSMTSVGEVSAEEGREKFLCTQPELSRQPFVYETRMVPQDHYQCTVLPFHRVCLLCFSVRFNLTATVSRKKTHTRRSTRHLATKSADILFVNLPHCGISQRRRLPKRILVPVSH
jgi:hypothetical protein